MSRDDDCPDQQNEAGEPWPYGELADAAAEHLYGLWQLRQPEIALAVPAARAPLSSPCGCSSRVGQGNERASNHSDVGKPSPVLPW